MEGGREHGPPPHRGSISGRKPILLPAFVLDGNLWVGRGSDSLLSNPRTVRSTLILILWDPCSWQSLLRPNLLADADKALSKGTNHCDCASPSLTKPCGLGPTLSHFLLHNRHLLNCCNSLQCPHSMSGEGTLSSCLICQLHKSKCQRCPLNRKPSLYNWIYF